MRFTFISVLALSVLVAACNPGEKRVTEGNDGRIPIRLDRSSEDMLVRYYFGAYLTPAANPVAAGLVQQVGGVWYLNRPSGVQGALPVLDSLFTAHRESEISWEILEGFLIDTWYDAREFPRSVEELSDVTGEFRQDSLWFRLDVTGSMSPFERHIHVPVSAVMEALESGAESNQMLYPVGTWFIADHIENGRVVETTAMVKRADSLWDYVAYNAAGALTSEIRKHDGTMIVPTQCLGCHTGNRGFEPERSFPAEATPGPGGPRRVHVGDLFRDPVVTAALAEHMKRADTILGLYATVFLSGIRSRAIQGEASPEQRALLDRYGLSP